MHILLIEDDSLLASTILRQLRKRGFTVSHVIGIGGAFDHIVAETKFDLVITDRDVVGGDAWDFVNKAVELGQLPANPIFMSGRVPAEEPVRFWLKGDQPMSKLLDMVGEAADERK